MRAQYHHDEYGARHDAEQQHLAVQQQLDHRGAEPDSQLLERLVEQHERERHDRCLRIDLAVELEQHLRLDHPVQLGQQQLAVRHVVVEQLVDHRQVRIGVLRFDDQVIARPLAATIGTVLLAAFAAAGCDRPASTAVNNTGNSASVDPGRLAPSTEVAPPTGDTASPNSPALASSSNGVQGGNMSGALAETATTGKVKAAIAADAGLRDSDISVDTRDGVVTLSGTVKSQDQASIATQLAQRQEGVTRVQNQLAVR